MKDLLEHPIIGPFVFCTILGVIIAVLFACYLLLTILFEPVNCDHTMAMPDKEKMEGEPFCVTCKKTLNQINNEN